MTELADKKSDDESFGIFQPLDYSFLNIKNLSDLPVCSPRIIPSINSVIKKDINGKWISQTLKINNNQIEDISTLPIVVYELLGDTSNLTWLDLSCNNIPSIPNLSLLVVLNT
uniref:Leucine-rich repeat-containing protein 51 n=1 Tax=Schistosoma mansoni TaxID=6183 RepID=A0A5K4FAL3_SCHMA